MIFSDHLYPLQRTLGKKTKTVEGEIVTLNLCTEISRRCKLSQSFAWLPTRKNWSCSCFSRSVVSNSCDPVDWPPLSMVFPRQEYWNGLLGLPFPSPGDLANPGIEPTSPALQADSLPLSHQQSPRAGEDPANQLETNTQKLRKNSFKLV